ncbi:Type II restriction/modification system, DNA methylase subunit YeeA [Reichenbachiella faecimaris]|uniref:site-specific DNA-methyltransferase (adenine-specific) n=1 Tax=Reichenbachiella faecimaris TaxID=692418 RepID=A0A1W2GBL5_REIFA|nr:DNA methyltransferase [Reichenbachiella faecimaris]SMD34013.1 Type II restriction/modification system, DNA methylase subunit YeeA [Reichenbachiella faecimaris]
MLLSKNQIKKNALAFAKTWEGEKRERAEKDTFWNEFFEVFGVGRRRVASFEEPVKKLSGAQGFIDLFWKGQLIVEHKSRGGNLEKAYGQAIDYFPGIKDEELPRYVLVSDFERFKLYDLDNKTEHAFPLKEFQNKTHLFGFISGYEERKIVEQDPVNIKAAQLVGQLHEKLESYGFEGHQLEIYLVRLVFCLFADDAGIFEKDLLLQYIERRTNPDGSDLGMHLSKLFQVLNKPMDKRATNLDEDLQQFPYVNGGIFAETVEIPDFDAEMRQIFLACSYLDWSVISPAIFGSMFQSVMNPEERRNLGAHYTSEKNILRLIKPLFLDELYDEFEKVKGNTKQLAQFHKKLSTLKFLDPACGCGNFLVITYRELRMLELEILRVTYKKQRAIAIDQIIWVDVDQFYGIEYDEWPARIAEVALWLVDHQMNRVISQEFGEYFARLPLKKSAKIVNDNALRIDWQEVVPKSELSYILGNPPFLGHHYQSPEQKKDLKHIFVDVKGSGVLDYVSAWYVKAAQYIQQSNVEVAFVSTSSISQGEQVGLLWSELIKYKLKISFAHRTFNWSNEARSNAAVHVVIIGFGVHDKKQNAIYHYSDIKGEPTKENAKHINPYLVNAADVIIRNTSNPICDVPKMIWGNKPTDDGNFLFADEKEKEEFLIIEPNARNWVRPFLSGQNLINNNYRYCLWLKDITPNELKKLPHVIDRIEKIKRFRIDSKAEATRKKALTPTLFAQTSQPDSDYLAVPEVSSERRKYIPIAYLNSSVIASNTIQLVPNASKYHFGVLVSIMHMIWVRNVCGRLKSDFRYSNTIVYNNYPWPKDPSAKNKKKVEACAQAVLDARASFPKSSLADLYDPLTMPPVLVKAHQALDKAVDLCYRPQAFVDETARIEYLFDLYSEYTAPLFKPEKKKAKGNR